MATRTARTRTTRSLLAAGGVLMAFTAVTACADASEDKTPEKKSFAYDGKNLVVKAGDAALDIQPADVDKIEVTRWFSGWSVLGESPKARWSLKGDTLSLKINCGSHLAGDCSARHKVLVPRDVAVTVDGVNGKVTASGFHSDLKIHTSNGSVLVKNSSGKQLSLGTSNGSLKTTGTEYTDVSAHSSNGAINLSLAKVPDRVRATTSNGRVTVEVPGGASYDVDTKTSNGSKDVDVKQDPDSSHAITAETSNGSIAVRPAG